MGHTVTYYSFHDEMFFYALFFCFVCVFYFGGQLQKQRTDMREQGDKHNRSA